MGALIHVEIPADVEASLADAVAAGEYASNEDIVAEALRAWSAHRPYAVWIEQKLNEAVAANGPYYPADEVKAALLNRYAPETPAT